MRLNENAKTLNFDDRNSQRRVTGCGYRVRPGLVVGDLVGFVSHHVVTIDNHTVFVTGPDADALAKRMALCLRRFDGTTDFELENMTVSVADIATSLHVTAHHHDSLQVMMARVVHAAQSDDHWAALRDGILRGVLKFDTKGMH